MFRPGEIVLIGRISRYDRSLEIRRVVRDEGETVLINYGAFNTSIGRDAVHKCPASIKKQLKEPTHD